jgi:imidazole glycerol-phosphate synthase subunit HisF
MLAPRIIPCLLVQDGGLVKTVNFDKPKYVGDPINAVRIFNEKEVDEIIVLDISATLEGREPDYTMIANLAAECRMPLCYGGGVRTSAQVQKIIQLGVEKVALSSAAIENPPVVTEAASHVGSQSVVVVLDVRQRRAQESRGFLRRVLGSTHSTTDDASGAVAGYEVWTHSGRRNTQKSPTTIAKQMADAGAGEIVINSIDNDGMMRGYDLTVVEEVRTSVGVPLTVLGGAGSLDDIGSVVEKYGSTIGVAVGSFFVFKGPNRAVLITYPSRAEKEELSRRHRQGPS